jgi:hypothetical protein
MADASFPSPSPLARLRQLEARYDGPIPTDELRALRFGSLLAAEIAETRSEIVFFRELILRTRRAAKQWRESGQAAATKDALGDLRAYHAAWRNRHRSLAKLLDEKRSRESEARVADARSRTLEAIADLVIAPLARAASDRPRMSP